MSKTEDLTRLRHMFDAAVKLSSSRGTVIVLTLTEMRNFRFQSFGSWKFWAKQPRVFHNSAVSNTRKSHGDRSQPRGIG